MAGMKGTFNAILETLWQRRNSMDERMLWYFQRRRAKVPVITTGFKAVEEAEELVAAIASGDTEAIIRETADLVLVAAVVARQYGFSLEGAIVVKALYDSGRGAPKQDPRVVRPADVGIMAMVADVKRFLPPCMEEFKAKDDDRFPYICSLRKGHEGRHAAPPLPLVEADLFVTCGIDGCEFAVERGEGRTMALHREDAHPRPYDYPTEGFGGT